MREVYNSHIITYTDCSVGDLQKLRDLSISLGKVSTRVAQGDKKEGDKKEVEIEGLFKETLEEHGINTSSTFSVKFIVRNPGKGFIDINDQRSLEKPSSVDEEGLRAPPYFFRYDGSSIDMVNIYRGQSAFLVLNGSSLNDIDLSLLNVPGVITMGVNNGAHSFRPDLWSCVDDPSRFMPSIWLDPKIKKFIPQAHFPKPILDCDNNKLSSTLVSGCPNVFGFRRNEKFNHETFLTEPTINWGNHGSLGGGRSVMLSSIRILHLLGIRTIYLAGCDFYMDSENKYFFEENRDTGAINNNMNSYRIMMGYFEKLAPVFKKAGLSVYNTNIKSKLQAFPYMKYEEAVVRATRRMLKELDRPTLGMYVNRR
jgi:hypothetical protein